jgi:hypothetical protein
MSPIKNGLSKFPKITDSIVKFKCFLDIMGAWRVGSMKPLEILYWTRFLLGLVAALICIGYEYATKTIGRDVLGFNIFMNAFALAIIVYVLSYYLFKPRFMPKVEKPQKILTTGIGIYFLSWIVFWVLIYTILAA